MSKKESEHLEYTREVDTCALFPPKYDFKNVCSCDECSSIISMLKEFEEDLKSKLKQVTDCTSQLHSAAEHCFCVNLASIWSTDMLDLLLNNLKAIDENLGLSLTLEESKRELKDVDLKIQRLISDSGLVPGYEDSNDDEEAETTCIPCFTDAQGIYHEIKGGIYYYKNTKVKEEAHGLLEQILWLERMHEADQKSAEEKGKTLHPLISKKYIEQQIECVKLLPVEELYSEVEDEIDKVSHITKNRKKLLAARCCILDDVSCVMVNTRKRFWLQYQEKHKGVTGHDLTGLKDTLAKLSHKANSFKARWKEDYAHFVAPYE